MTQSDSLIHTSAFHAMLHKKSQRPHGQPHSIKRSSLLLKAISQHSIVWLNAPAGYGKTTLMADTACEFERQGRVVVWLNLDIPSLSSDELLHYLLECLSGHDLASFTPALMHWQATKERGCVDVEQVLLLTLEAMQNQSSTVLFLDDVHRVQNIETWQVLLRFLEWMPKGISVVLAGRYLPYALGRLRLAQTIQWMVDTDLVFEVDQVQQYLEQHSVRDVTQWVYPLMQRLQGWPAGLALWAARYKKLNAFEEVSSHLAEEDITDYLLAEALSELTASERDFLCHIALLGEFSEALLAHCYGNDHYHEWLQALLARNCFIRNDEKRLGWYLVHPIVQSCLARHLPLHTRQDWHGKAFYWFSQHQYPVAALKQALLADMKEDIQQWIEQESEAILANLDVSHLLRWFEQMGDALLQQSPRLMVMATWVLLMSQQRAAAERLFEHLQRQAVLEPYEIHALQGYLARLDGHLELSRTLCSEALEHIPRKRFVLRSIMSSILTHLCVAEHDINGARYWNRFSQDIARQNKAEAMEALCLFDQARIELNQGQVKNSLDVVQQGLAVLANVSDASERLPRGRLLVYQGLLLWLTSGSETELNTVLRQGIRLSTETRDLNVCYGFAVMAMRSASERHFDEALAALEQAERLMQRWQVEFVHYQWLDILRINLWISQSKYLKAQQALDSLLNHKQWHHPELLPMMPSFLQASQARLFLHAGRVQEGLDIIEQALRARPNMLSQLTLHLLKVMALRLLNHGVESQQLLAQTVRLLQRQNISLSILDWMLNESSVPTNDHLIVSSHLSERELDVLRKVAQGLSNQEIADQLFISLHTVKTHVRKIYVKLAAKSRTQALHRARELELI